ncbi:interleukin-15 isoform X1 [Bubalus bubalis]|uniref:interleukin-15 isoform X1 n=1 Tax=Bubalus bubalis TaxID=89462 RepID=UPI00042CF2F1|nr:interleukin-15 isoform X1 [Bubalus bubalis]
MDFGSPSRSFPACVPRGRDRPRPRPTSQEAGQERLACLPPPCPPGSAPPGLALEYTSQGAWSQDTWGTRPRAAATRPSPSLRWGCLSWPFLLALFSFTFLFVGGWDSLGSRSPGKPQLICLWPQRPDARDGSRVTAPAPLHCLPPLTLQPGVDGAEHRLLVHLWLPRGSPAAPRCALLFPRGAVRSTYSAPGGGEQGKRTRLPAPSCGVRRKRSPAAQSAEFCTSSSSESSKSIPTYGHVALQNNVSSCAMLVMSQEVKKSMLADSQHIGGHNLD